MSISSIEMPSCGLASASVRTRQKIQSAKWAIVVHVFWPLTMYLSPRRSALVRSEARSEPAPGSEYPWHQKSSTVGMRGRKRSLCAWLAYFISTGPIIVSPNGSMRGAPARNDSISKISRCSAFQPVPPHSFGQVGAPQPCACRMRCQRT